jgi:hypothetical protein
MLSVKANPLRAERRLTVRNIAVPVYSEVNTPLAIDSSGISPAVSPLKGSSWPGIPGGFGRAPREHPAPSDESSIGGCKVQAQPAVLSTY